MSKIKLMRKNNSIYILVVITVQLIIGLHACKSVQLLTLAVSDQQAHCMMMMAMVLDCLFSLPSTS
jgi:hypothetical protein